MQETLIIFLHAETPLNPDWVVVDQGNMVTQQVLGGNAAELSVLANQRNVFVIVPTEDVLITTVTLPKMTKLRLQKALPFALEEQLIDEIDQLHFASGEYQENGELPVAVVAQTKMQTWVAHIKEWHIKPDAIIPLTLTVPVETDTIHMAVDKVANVRLDEFQGFACDVDNLQSCFNLAITESTKIPAVIKIHNATTRSCKDLLKVTARIDEQLITREALLGLLAKTVLKTPYLNLLQGQFKTKKTRLPETQRLVKAASILLASWLVFLILYPLGSYIILDSRLHQINSEIETIYKRHFPASKMIAPKMQMDDKLRKLEGGSGQNRFLLLLGYVGQGLSHGDNVKLKRLDFQSGQLSLEISATTSEDFRSFTNFLTSEGLEVKQQNATLAGSHVNATLQVE